MKKSCMTLALLFLLFSSCKKQVDSSNPETAYRVNTLSEVKVNLMTRIINIAKNSPEFKTAVENECLKQVRGDYNVALDRILEIDRQTSIIPIGEKNAFVSLVNQMKEFRPGEMPIIFVPVMENRDPKSAPRGEIVDPKGINKIKVNPANPGNFVIMIDQDNQVRPLSSLSENNGLRKAVNLEQDPGDGSGGGGGGSSCAPPYYYPGYIIDDYGNLTYTDCIDEAFAWTHDVWVLGYEEVVSPGNDVVSPIDQTLYVGTDSRWEGFEETGGKIQVTDLGAIEPFVRGKLEFKYYVHSASGTVIKEHAYGKLKRDHFDNSSKWAYLNDFIGYWNTATWGNITYEHWIEEDGGTTSAINQVISYVSNGVTYTTTITIPARSSDNDLGSANIQFTDPIFYIPLANVSSNKSIYSFNYMNVQRERGPH